MGICRVFFATVSSIFGSISIDLYIHADAERKKNNSDIISGIYCFLP